MIYIHESCGFGPNVLDAEGRCEEQQPKQTLLAIRGCLGVSCIYSPIIAEIGTSQHVSPSCVGYLQVNVEELGYSIRSLPRLGES